MTAAPAAWFAALSTELLGRRVATRTAGELAAGADPGLDRVETVKLATHKRRLMPLQRVADLAAARTWAATLPPTYQLLLSDRWLQMHSEYRVFTIGRQAVAWSPYLVEDEPWSPELSWHRASFHDEAAAYAEAVLADLPDADVPPAVVLDIARTENARLVLLEANTTWGAGLYGCDPERVLDAVLAANLPAHPRWRWTP